MSDRRGVAADGVAVDTHGLASLQLGLELVVEVLLLGDDFRKDLGHSLESLLAGIVDFVHSLFVGSLGHLVAEGVLGSGLRYQGDNFSQEGDLFILLHGRGFGDMHYWSGLLLRGCNVGQGCCTTAEVVVFHLHKEPAIGADPLSLVPGCACFAGVEVLFAGYLE